MTTHVQQALDFLRWLRGVWENPANWEGLYCRLDSHRRFCRGLCSALVIGVDEWSCPLGAPPLSVEAARVVTHLLSDRSFRKRVEWPSLRSRRGNVVYSRFYTPPDHPNPQANQLRLLDAVIATLQERIGSDVR